MKRKSTKDVIADTVFDLLQAQKIEEITISQIIEEAEISVRTFYNHFKDKYDVVNYIYIRMLEKECWYQDGKRCNWEDFMSKMAFNISGPYLNYFTHTLGYTGQNNLHQTIVEYTTKDIIDQLIYTGHKHLVTMETIDIIEFFAHGLDSFFTTGICNKMKNHRIENAQNTTRFLPNDLCEALIAEPIYAPVKEWTEKKKSKK